MSKVSRLVHPGFTRNEKRIRSMMDRRKAAKSEDRLGLLRKKSKKKLDDADVDAQALGT